MQQNAFELASVFILDIVATLTGPQYIFFVAPLVVGAIVLMLVRYSFRHTTDTPIKRGDAAHFLIDERAEDQQIIGKHHDTSA